MSAYCDSMDLPGFSHWMRIQSQEEYAHAMNLLDFVQARQGRVTLFPIDQPAVEFDSILGVMETTLGHERQVTKLINQLYELATGERDYQTQVHLQAFITEQIEEEKTASDIIAQLKMIGENTSDLLILDKGMATRQLSPGL
ncbi:Bacterial non-heme ferritin [Geodia barretti]|uniref:Ferritin n=1 Tax=Geodia barretti TaxID=519541 RepID=A0AA35TRS8_GEOBA|nr:Bacterial non-heme ferritin [Geodia barretti]